MLHSAASKAEFPLLWYSEVIASKAEVLTACRKDQPHTLKCRGGLAAANGSLGIFSDENCK